MQGGEFVGGKGPSLTIDNLQLTIDNFSFRTPLPACHFVIFLLLFCLTACQSPTITVPPTQVVALVPEIAPTITLPGETAVSDTSALPPTWTPEPVVAESYQSGVVTVPDTLPTRAPLFPTYTPPILATYTPVTPPPTKTPVPPTTDPNAPLPTATFLPTPSLVATLPGNQTLGPNLLPNPSFEEGWYHQGGLPELQLPNEWDFDWDEGPTYFGNKPWDVWVRPETRVLPANLLPVAERPLFIYDGQYTLKMFKGYGAISFRLTTDLTLEPGTYRLEVNIYPDLIMEYTSTGQKVWADDPLSGEIKLLAGPHETAWLLPTFGQKNTLTYDFTLTEAQTVQVGVAVRGRFAIVNNGWFLDDFSLQRVGQ